MPMPYPKQSDSPSYSYYRNRLYIMVIQIQNQGQSSNIISPFSCYHTSPTDYQSCQTEQTRRRKHQEAMAESEKLVALKKAYADIILNTAKEAASRVMESERKALRYHHDLCNSKDEALRLLLRLKQMIDAKTTEAEIKSSKQQNKIDELEAQLQEAEGVIVDLRAELQWVRDELEKVRNNQLHPLNGRVVKENELSPQNLTSEPIILSPDLAPAAVVSSDVKNALLDQRNFNSKCCNTTEHSGKSSALPFENYSSQNADLSSIIMTNKELELYKNGCTQRVRASEGNFLGSTLPPSVVVDQQSFIKNEVINKARDEGEFTLPSPKSKNLEKLRNFSGEKVRKQVKVCTLRRRKSRFAKAKVKRKPCLNVMKPHQSPSIVSQRKTYSVNRTVKSDVSSCILPLVKPSSVDMKNHPSSLEENLLEKNCCPTSEMIVREEKRPKTEQSTDVVSTSSTPPLDQHSKFCQPSSVLTHCKTYSFLLRGAVKCLEDQSKITENDVKLKSLPRFDPGLTLIRGSVDPTSGSINSQASSKPHRRLDVVNSEETKDMECADGVVKELHSNHNPTVRCYASNDGMVDVPVLFSNLEDAKTSEETILSVPQVPSDIEDAKASKEPNVFPSQSEDRFLKFTFHRKRKKGLMKIPDSNISSEMSVLKRKAQEMQEDSVEAQNSSLINESNRDSRRLAQVARQLISLSGKRWRQ